MSRPQQSVTVGADGGLTGSGQQAPAAGGRGAPRWGLWRGGVQMRQVMQIWHWSENF